MDPVETASPVCLRKRRLYGSPVYKDLLKENYGREKIGYTFYIIQI
jgi:hypothetical protein